MPLHRTIVVDRQHPTCAASRGAALRGSEGSRTRVDGRIHNPAGLQSRMHAGAGCWHIAPRTGTCHQRACWRSTRRAATRLTDECVGVLCGGLRHSCGGAGSAGQPQRRFPWTELTGPGRLPCLVKCERSSTVHTHFDCRIGTLHCRVRHRHSTGLVTKALPSTVVVGAATGRRGVAMRRRC